MDSVRYGIIGAYVTNKMIKMGEELFANYGPTYANLLEESGNPETMWYYSLWKKFKEENPDKLQYIKYYEDINRSYWI